MAYIELILSKVKLYINHPVPVSLKTRSSPPLEDHSAYKCLGTTLCRHLSHFQGSCRHWRPCFPSMRAYQVYPWHRERNIQHCLPRVSRILLCANHSLSTWLALHSYPQEGQTTRWKGLDDLWERLRTWRLWDEDRCFWRHWDCRQEGHLSRWFARQRRFH